MVKGFLWPLPGGNDLPGFGFSVPDGSARVDEVDIRDLEPEQIAGSDAVAAAKGRRESLAERMRRIFFGESQGAALEPSPQSSLWPFGPEKPENAPDNPSFRQPGGNTAPGFGSINGATSPFSGKIS